MAPTIRQLQNRRAALQGRATFEQYMSLTAAEAATRQEISRIDAILFDHFGPGYGYGPTAVELRAPAA